MPSILYFAYGSNMFSRRLRHPSRVPTAQQIATGFIVEHQLKFDKKSKDGSAKCDAEHTGHEEDVVHGVVYEIDAALKPQLDQVEGLGLGYQEKRVSVRVGTSVHDAVMYYATDKDVSLKPYDWYKGHVVTGAKEHGLPLLYIAKLEAVEAVIDPVKARSDSEAAI